MSVVVNAASSTPLRDLHGRGMNPKTNDYNLPADLEEFNVGNGQLLSGAR